MSNRSRLSFASSAEQFRMRSEQDAVRRGEMESIFRWVDEIMDRGVTKLATAPEIASQDNK